MKIWHLTRTLLGGAGQYASRLSNALRAAGYDSTVLLKEGPVVDGALTLKKTGSTVRHLAARLFRSLSHRIALSPYHSIRGLELYDAPVSILPGDIIHLHGLTDWIGVAGLEKLIPMGAQVFQTAHGGWEISGGCVTLAGTQCRQFASDCAACPALRRPWKSLGRMELQAKCRFANKHRIRPIANSTWTAGIIRRSLVYRGALRVPVIHPIVHEAFLNPHRQAARAAFGIPDGTRIIGMGARAVTDPYKGIVQFLQRFSAQSELVSRSVILLFGDGRIEYPGNLNVIELGAVTQLKKVAKILCAGDVFVSPSSVESFGMLLAESQAVGTPVVGFEVGGTRDAVFPGLSQNLVPLHRWEQLFERVSQFVKGPTIEQPLRQEMRRWAHKTFSPSAIAEKQVQCYGLKSHALV